MSKTENQIIGETGENIVARFLKDRGYTIVERNYKRPWGELDIVAFKDSVLHVIEVKAMTIREGGGQSRDFSPEDHLNYHKVKRLKRAIETYLVDRYKEGEEPEWQLDLAAVELNMERKHAKVRFLEGLEIE